MIAACPKCQTRYRVEAERLGSDGARLRCSQCSSVFRVRLPEASASGANGAARSEPQASEASMARDGIGATQSGVAARSVAAPAEEPPAAQRVEQAAQRVEQAAPRPRPPVPAEAPVFDRARLVLVAHPNPDACKRIAEALEADGLQVLVAHDGVEAILSIQRALPRAVALDAALPKMFGFQVCELVKRNESLRSIHVCMMGAIHREDRYRRAPNEIYGADFYVEPPSLPGALLDWLARSGLSVRSRPSAPVVPDDAPALDVPDEAPSSQVTQQGGAHASAAAASGGAARSEAKSAEPSEAHQARVPLGNQPRAAGGRSTPTPTEAPVTAARPAAPAAAQTKLTLGRVGAPADALGAERAQAERLARIIVSDIVLYNEEKFTAAVRSGNAVEALRDELEEGRALFRERIDARIREERDYLADELERVARTRGMA